MKIFIITDLEGPSGVNGRPAAGIGNQIINPETARRALVNEVNATVDGLLDAGATEIVVIDGHGGSNSIDIFALHPAAQLIQYGDSMYGALLDSSYDALVQIGAHGMQESGGFMCHSFNSHSICSIKLNGRPIGEIGVQAMLAAYFGIPTILVSGDETACAEARTLLGNEIIDVPTKQAYSRYTVCNYPVEKVYAALRQGAQTALQKRSAIPVLKIPPTLELTYTLMCPNQVDQFEFSGAERMDGQTLRYRGNDFFKLWYGSHMSAPALARCYETVVQKTNRRHS